MTDAEFQSLIRSIANLPKGSCKNGEPVPLGLDDLCRILFGALTPGEESVATDRSAALFFKGKPSGIASSAGVVTSWRDDRGVTYPVFAATAAPPLAASGGVGPFTGAQYLQCTTAIPSDAEVVILLVSSQVSSAGGGILEMSDTVNSNRSVMVVNDSGFRAAKYAGTDTAFFAYAGAQGRTLERIMHSEFARGFFVGGKYSTDTNEHAVGVRAPTFVRLGNYMQGAAGFDGVIEEVWVFITRPEDEELDSCESSICTSWSLTAPPVLWPPGSPTVVSGDPRFVLPAYVDCVAGEDVELWRESIRYRDGYTDTQLISSPLVPDPDAPPDRWRFRAPAPGEYKLVWEESGYYGQTILRVTPRVAGPGAAQVNVVIAGDSITQAGSWVWRLHDLMKGKLTMQGSLTVDGIKQDGRSGWSYTLFDTAGSPFFNGGPALNLAGYDTAIGAIPKIVYLVLGTNDWNATDATIEAAITTSFVHADALIAGWHAIDPTIAVVLVTPFPGNGNSVPWGGATLRYQFLRCMNRGVRRMLDTYDKREAEEIYVAWPFGQIDSQRGFRYDSGVGDTIHPNRVVGDREIARAIYGWTNWYIQRKGL